MGTSPSDIDINFSNLLKSTRDFYLLFKIKLLNPLIGTQAITQIIILNAMTTVCFL